MKAESGEQLGKNITGEHASYPVRSRERRTIGHIVQRFGAVESNGDGKAELCVEIETVDRKEGGRGVCHRHAGTKVHRLPTHDWSISMYAEGPSLLSVHARLNLIMASTISRILCRGGKRKEERKKCKLPEPRLMAARPCCWVVFRCWSCCRKEGEECRVGGVQRANDQLQTCLRVIGGSHRRSSIAQSGVIMSHRRKTSLSRKRGLLKIYNFLRQTLFRCFRPKVHHLRAAERATWYRSRQVPTLIAKTEELRRGRQHDTAGSETNTLKTRQKFFFFCNCRNGQKKLKYWPRALRLRSVRVARPATAESDRREHKQ